jgi:hypothetical protein
MEFGLGSDRANAIRFNRRGIDRILTDKMPIAWQFHIDSDSEVSGK